MKFKMNDREWEIKELSQEEMRQHIIDYKYDGQPESGRYYGQTYFSEQKIYLDKDLHIEQKKQTLLHELMHCYLGCFLFQNSRDYTEEDLCNISASSYNLIHKVIEDYFKKENKEK